MITLNKARARTNTQKHTHTHTKPHAPTLGSRELYLEACNTDKRQISLPPAGYEPAILVVNGSLIWIF